MKGKECKQQKVGIGKLAFVRKTHLGKRFDLGVQIIADDFMDGRGIEFPARLPGHAIRENGGAILPH